MGRASTANLPRIRTMNLRNAPLSAIASWSAGLAGNGADTAFELGSPSAFQGLPKLPGPSQKLRPTKAFGVAAALQDGRRVGERVRHGADTAPVHEEELR